MALHVVYFKKNKETKLEPVRFEPQTQEHASTVPMEILRQNASCEAQKIGADFFAFYGRRGSRATMIFDKNNRINHFANSERCWPTNVKTVAQLKKM